MARFEKSFCWLSAALLILAAAVFLSCDSGAQRAGGGAAGAKEEYKVLDSRTVPDNAFSDPATHWNTAGKTDQWHTHIIQHFLTNAGTRSNQCVENTFWNAFAFHNTVNDILNRYCT